MEENKPVDPYAKYNEQSNIIAKIILLVRWLQVPILFGFALSPLRSTLISLLKACGHW